MAENQPAGAKYCIKCNKQFEASLTRCPDCNIRLAGYSADPIVGTTIEKRYKVERVIGTGGWANVYEAKDMSLPRRAAIKVLHAVHLTDPQRIARFMREAQTFAQLQQRNICEVYDFGFLPQGQPYIVMEYLDGTSLSKYLFEQRSLPAAQAANVAIQACDALSHAHKKGIVHRDIKPSNIMILNDGIVKLLDFGLAKATSDKDDQGLTASGVTVGTAEYMSPEQCFGGTISPTSDIYSLGCVLFEMLTGTPPFEGANDLEFMQKHANEKAPTLQARAPEKTFSPQLEAVVARALDKNPLRRFDDAYGLKHQLREACLIPAKTSGAPWIKTFRVAALWILALLCVAAAAVSMALMPAERGADTRLNGR